MKIIWLIFEAASPPTIVFVMYGLGFPAIAIFIALLFLIVFGVVFITQSIHIDTQRELLNLLGPEDKNTNTTKIGLKNVTSRRW